MGNFIYNTVKYFSLVLYLLNLLTHVEGNLSKCLKF